MYIARLHYEQYQSRPSNLITHCDCVIAAAASYLPPTTPRWSSYEQIRQRQSLISHVSMFEMAQWTISLVRGLSPWNMGVHGCLVRRIFCSFSRRRDLHACSCTWCAELYKDGAVSELVNAKLASSSWTPESSPSFINLIKQRSEAWRERVRAARPDVCYTIAWQLTHCSMHKVVIGWRLWNI